MNFYINTFANRTRTKSYLFFIACKSLSCPKQKYCPPMFFVYIKKTKNINPTCLPGKVWH